MPASIAMVTAALTVRAADAGPALPLGGAATVIDVSRNAFGNAIPGLSEAQQRDFFVGNSFVKRNWVQAPASTGARDGLGPLFNARSCAACHVLDGRASPPRLRDSADQPSPGLVLRLSVPGEDEQGAPLPEPSYGTQLSTQAVAGVPAEGSLQLQYVERRGQYADGQPFSLREPRYTITALAHGPMAAGAMISPRLAPQMVGMGLLEAIPESDLQAIAERQAAAGDGVQGRLNRVWDIEAGRFVAGRFGWKAGAGSVAQQAAAAFQQDIGITSSLLPEETCTAVQVACRQAPRGGVGATSAQEPGPATNPFIDAALGVTGAALGAHRPSTWPEIDDALLQKVIHYTRALAVPAQRQPDHPQVRRGEALFRQLGCAACHVEQHRTGVVPGYAALSEQRIRPYTDLLLHDMGAGLADGRPDHRAGPRDWRTPPLWGLGLLATVQGEALLLHDGRARNPAEAILWHGGEAQPARERFRRLPRAEREALLRFLQSL